jgi:hypothetical protein
MQQAARDTLIAFMADLGGTLGVLRPVNPMVRLDRHHRCAILVIGWAITAAQVA